MKFRKKSNGMSIIGAGSRIMRFAFPSLIVAILVHNLAPAVARLPVVYAWMKPVGLVVIAAGILLWWVSAVQILVGFPKGKLIKNGVYAVCRNPMYSSFCLFLMPGIALVTGTWVYLPVSLFILWGTARYLGEEEQLLHKAFGIEYELYAASVSRLFPFVKPWAQK